MLFNPKNTVIKEGCFKIPEHVRAVAHSCFLPEVIAEYWSGFTFTFSELNVNGTDDLTFTVGDAEGLSLDGFSYSINVTQSGVCIRGENKNELIRGFMTLLDRIYAADNENGDTDVLIDCCEIRDKAEIKNRMVHFCIFPETELWELERFIRFTAALKYSHVILEFWGMLKYECMDELSWSMAYSKDKIRPIIKLANDAGLEIVPMFNHWGHASASRSIHGKHVVLDQNPKLQTYFNPDGWTWNIESKKVRALLKKVRDELCELCGEGSYFHIGCDEADNFDLNNVHLRDAICDSLNEIASDLKSSGRRAIAWGDMFLFKHPEFSDKNNYFCNSPSEECEKYILDRLSKDIIIADWQYLCPVFPVETPSVFKNNGFDCMLCPWDCGEDNSIASTETVKAYDIFGIIHTTWHRLNVHMPYVALIGVGGYEKLTKENSSMTSFPAKSAAFMRKVYKCNGDYEKAGWSKYQVGVIT